MKLEEVSIKLVVDGADAQTPVKGSYGPEVFPHIITVNASERGVWDVKVHGWKVKRDGTPSQVDAYASFPTWNGSRPTWPQFVKDAADMAMRMGGWTE